MLKSSMRIRLLALYLVACSMLGVSACHVTDAFDASGNETASDSFSFRIEVSQQSRLRIAGINGPITITARPGVPAVEIWGEKSVTSRSQSDARSYLSRLEVRVSDSHDEIVVKTVQPDDTDGRSLEVEYHLLVPDYWLASIENVNGEVTLDSLRNHCDVVVLNGNVRLRQITGSVQVSLTNGNVFLAGIQGNSEVHLINGNIFAEVTMPPSGSCEMNATNGAIDLRIPRDTSAQVSAEVTNGSIMITELVLHQSTSSTHIVQGRLADGEGTIALRTVNGNIRVGGF